MITLKQLRYLSALSRHGHFGKAAEACTVSQPALSMQIQELEAELGVPLVERRPGEVAFTDVGAEVARRAERVLAATRDLADFAHHRGRLLTGRMQLGVIPSIAPYVLPKILPVLQRRHPDLRQRAAFEPVGRGGIDVHAFGQGHHRVAERRRRERFEVLRLRHLDVHVEARGGIGARRFGLGFDRRREQPFEFPAARERRRFRARVCASRPSS